MKRVSIAEAMNTGSCVKETREEIEAGLDDVASRSRAKRDDKKSKGYYLHRKTKQGFVPSAEAMRLLWTDLHNEHFKGIPCPALPGRSIKNLRDYAREFAGRNRDSEWEEMLKWVFANLVAAKRNAMTEEDE